MGQIKIFINFVKEIFTNIDILINYAGIKSNNDNINNTNSLKMSDAIKEILNNETQDTDAESSTKEDVKEVMEHLDTDHSGHINFEEFSQLIKDILSAMIEENMFLNAISAFLINTNSLRGINISDKEIN